jgi:hypothetical protein
MGERVAWTPSMDEALRRVRAKGATWDAAAAALGLGRETVRERGRRIGAERPLALAVPKVERGEDFRPPLPPGHEVTWGLLTSGTVLEGEAYPLRWFHS